MGKVIRDKHRPLSERFCRKKRKTDEQIYLAGLKQKEHSVIGKKVTL